jgi:hypothetical protein
MNGDQITREIISNLGEKKFLGHLILIFQDKINYFCLCSNKIIWHIKKTFTNDILKSNQTG